MESFKIVLFLVLGYFWSNLKFTPKYSIAWAEWGIIQFLVAERLYIWSCLFVCLFVCLSVCLSQILSQILEKSQRNLHLGQADTGSCTEEYKQLCARVHMCTVNKLKTKTNMSIFALALAKLIKQLGFSVYTLYNVQRIHCIQCTHCTNCTMYTMYPPTAGNFYFGPQPASLV